MENVSVSSNVTHLSLDLQPESAKVDQKDLVVQNTNHAASTVLMSPPEEANATLVNRNIKESPKTDLPIGVNPLILAASNPVELKKTFTPVERTQELEQIRQLAAKNDDAVSTQSILKEIVDRLKGLGYNVEISSKLKGDPTPELETFTLDSFPGSVFYKIASTYEFNVSEQDGSSVKDLNLPTIQRKFLQLQKFLKPPYLLQITLKRPSPNWLSPSWRILIR